MGHEAREGCAEMGAVTRAGPATGAFGGARYGAAKRVRGVPNWARSRVRALPVGPSVEPSRLNAVAAAVPPRFCS